VKKILTPKEVLLAVVTHYANTEDYDPKAKILARFIDDAGSVELILIPPEINEDKNSLN